MSQEQEPIKRIGFESWREFEQALKGDDREYYMAKFEVETIRDQINSFERLHKKNKITNAVGYLAIAGASGASFVNYLTDNYILTVLTACFVALNIHFNVKLHNSYEMLKNGLKRSCGYILKQHKEHIDEDLKQKINWVYNL